MSESEVRELELFADSDEPLYRQKEAFIANTIRKKAAGTYNHEKAIQLWFYYAKRAKDSYMKQFGTSGDVYFSKADLLQVAKDYRDETEDNIRSGEYSNYIQKYTPKKYKNSVFVREHTR